MAPSSWEKFTNNIPSIFFSLTLRFVLLRIVCCLALIAFIDTLLLSKYFFLPVHIVIFVHHASMTFGPQFSLNGLIDLLFNLTEIGVIAWGTTAFRKVNQWSPRGALLAATLWWMLLVSVALLAILKITNTLKTKGRNLFVAYDITRPTWMEDVQNRAGDRPSSNERFRNALGILLGKALWKAHFRGEMKWVILTRGTLATSIIALITIFALFNVIVDPIRETALMPISNLRAYNLPPDFLPSTETVWNVVLTRLTDAPNNGADFSDAVKIVPLWSLDDNNPRPPCSFAPDKTIQTLFDIERDITLEIVTFHCPPREPVLKAQQLNFFPLSYQNSRPDLLVTVNFTMLGVTLGSIVDIPRNSVQIMLGLTNKTADVVRKTSPTTLIPGVNVVGLANCIIRQQIKPSSVSAFGLFDVYDTFLITEMVHVWPDPTTSPLITRRPDVATIRITPQNDPSEWQIILDSRDKSILKGFANVGGLWASLGGIFALFFGCTFIQIAFDIKPLSVFGLAHALQEDRLRNACLEDYPRIIHDMKPTPANRGFISLLCDHLIGVEFLTQCDTPSSSHLTSNEGSLNGDIENQIHQQETPVTFLQTIPPPLTDSINQQVQQSVSPC